MRSSICCVHLQWTEHVVVNVLLSVLNKPCEQHAAVKQLNRFVVMIYADICASGASFSAQRKFATYVAIISFLCQRHPFIV